MVLVFVLTQTVFPISSRKFALRCKESLGRCCESRRFPLFFQLVSRELITANGIALRSARMMQRRSPTREVAGLFGITHRT
jgi:hypothetical protein